ncbi:MAG: hypothetical protein IPK16_32895 [Anaerolineales bacterium]|nr:hypothetical protein [Anaerolineales bacterium]
MIHAITCALRDAAPGCRPGPISGLIFGDVLALLPVRACSTPPVDDDTGLFAPP